jgi:ATP-binding protein involved in chromosome partitioning
MQSPPSFNENDVLNALRLLPAPYMDMDVVAAGMIGDVAITGNDLSLTLTIKTPHRPVEAGLREGIKEALLKHIPSLGGVEISAVADIPGKSSAQKDAIIPGVRNTIAVASGKGGVGKSTVAVNLAVALARAGARVGLLDADIYGPSIPMMFGINEQPSAYMENGKTRMLPCDNFGVKVMSIGFLVEADAAVIWRGPMAAGALKQFLTDVEWGELDYLIFDLPPGTGDIQLTLSQTLPLTGAVVVTTPQDISLADARKGVRMFERVSVPILGIVENMSYHICPHCGTRDEIFGNGGGRAAAADLNVPFLGEIPIVTRLRESCDRGVPIVEMEPDGEVAKRFMEVAMCTAGAIARNVLTSPAETSIDISLGDAGNAG